MRHLMGRPQDLLEAEEAFKAVSKAFHCLIKEESMKGHDLVCARHGWIPCLPNSTAFTNCRRELQRRQWGLSYQTPYCGMLQKFDTEA